MRRGVLRVTESGLAFWCPGCQEFHLLSLSIWAFDGDYDKPTFTPSVLVTSGHFAQGHQGECWCTYNREHLDDPAPFRCSTCHSFVTEGRVNFLNDSTHNLAGQTVPLEAHGLDQGLDQETDDI